MAKKGIHPTYYVESKVTCSCGNEFIIGATKENIEVEICSACHPFYTGDEKGKMRGSQVEKFRERMAKKAPTQTKSNKRAPLPLRKDPLRRSSEASQNENPSTEK